jgi:hypothetical protein
MKRAADGKPVVGARFGELGVRPRDVEANPPGEAHPRNGGMSVQPSLGALAQKKYSWFVPNRLQDTNPLFRGATGPNDHSIWAMGSGPFVDSAVTAELNLHSDPPSPNGFVDHGVIEPAQIMAIEDFQKALAATRPDWNVEEK